MANYSGGAFEVTMSKDKREWVATMAFVDETAGKLIEEGGIYSEKPRWAASEAARPFNPAEHVAECPRCGQRFAATQQTPQENRDLHFYGDEDSPPICLPR